MELWEVKQTIILDSKVALEWQLGQVGVLSLLLKMKYLKQVAESIMEFKRLLEVIRTQLIEHLLINFAIQILVSITIAQM